MTETPSKDNCSITIVGFGHWGPNLVKAFESHPKCSVVSIVEQSESRRAVAQERFSHIPLFSSLEEACSQVECTSVAIATPTETHFKLGILALRLGKDVFIEKPLAHDSACAQELTDTAEKLDRISMTGHIFLFNEGVRYMRRCVEEGTLGNLLYLRSLRTNLGPIRTDVNALWDLASHDISIFDFLFGELPQRVSCTTHGPLGLRQSDVAQGSLEYSKNRVATFFVSWLDPVKRREITAIGDAKMLVFDDMLPDSPLKLYDKGVRFQPSAAYADTFQSFRTGIHQGEASDIACTTGEPLKSECTEFVDAVCAHRSPVTDGRNGVDVVRVLEALQLSANQGGTPVSLWHQGRH